MDVLRLGPTTVCVSTWKFVLDKWNLLWVDNLSLSIGGWLFSYTFNYCSSSSGILIDCSIFLETFFNGDPCTIWLVSGFFSGNAPFFVDWANPPPLRGVFPARYLVQSFP